MPRREVYATAFMAFLATTAMTVASIVIPNWVVWNSKTDSGPSIHYTYGLHSRCSSLTGKCTPYPDYSACRGRDRPFCSAWRTVGFLMSFSLVMQICSLVTFLIVLSPSSHKTPREARAWRLLSVLLLVPAVCEAVAMSVVAFLFDHDDRFALPDWHLGPGWALCTASWSVLLLVIAGMVGAAMMLPPQGDYELIPDAPPHGEGVVRPGA